jgi:hypothetical protein
VEVVRIGGEDDPAALPDGAPVSDVLDAADLAPGWPLVLVTWRDAWFDFDQPDDEEIRPDYLVTTVGFLVRQGPRFLSVAQELLPDGDGFRAVTHIPVAVVETMTTLRGEGPDVHGFAAP